MSGGVTPLARLVVGYALVLVDLRFNGFDLVPDLVGWGLVLWGLVPLTGRDGWFRLALGAAVVELMLALLGVGQPTGGIALLIDMVATMTFIFAVVTGIITAVDRDDVRAAGDPVRWTNLAVGLMVLFLVAAVDGDQVADLSDGVTLLVVLAGLGAVVWFLVFCWKQRAQPELV